MESVHTERIETHPAQADAAADARISGDGPADPVSAMCRRYMELAASVYSAKEGEPEVRRR